MMFFFQAEDGIRDIGVTGVQTCALPIFVFVNEGQRRMPITYAKRQVGRRMSQGGTTYLPLKVNMAGGFPIIFASSLFDFTGILGQFRRGGPNLLLGRGVTAFHPGGTSYLVLYALLCLMF